MYGYSDTNKTFECDILTLPKKQIVLYDRQQQTLQQKLFKPSNPRFGRFRSKWQSIQPSMAFSCTVNALTEWQQQHTPYVAVKFIQYDFSAK